MNERNHYKAMISFVNIFTLLFEGLVREPGRAQGEPGAGTSRVGQDILCAGNWMSTQYM